MRQPVEHRFFVETMSPIRVEIAPLRALLLTKNEPSVMVIVSGKLTLDHAMGQWLVVATTRLLGVPIVPLQVLCKTEVNPTVMVNVHGILLRINAR